MNIQEQLNLVAEEYDENRRRFICLNLQKILNS